MYINIERPYPKLNTIQMVDAIIRNFGLDLLQTIGTMPTPNYLMWLTERLDGLNDLFLGYERTKDEEFGYRRDPWNTSEELGRYLLKETCPNSTNVDLAVRDALIAYSLDILVISVIYDVEDELNWMHEIDAKTDKLVCSFLGYL